MTPIVGIMFLAYKYVFKPMDDEIDFYQDIAQRLDDYQIEQDFQRQQEQFRRESANARDITPLRDKNIK